MLTLGNNLSKWLPAGEVEYRGLSCPHISYYGNKSHEIREIVPHKP